MLVSTNCTVVDLVAAEPVRRAELADLGLHLALQCLQPGELVHPSGHLLEVTDDQRAQRGVALRGCDPRVAVHVIGDRDRNVLHSFTVTHFMVFSRGPSSSAVMSRTAPVAAATAAGTPIFGCLRLSPDGMTRRSSP